MARPDRDLLRRRVGSYESASPVADPGLVLRKKCPRGMCLRCVDKLPRDAPRMDNEGRDGEIARRERQGSRVLVE
jgi:hypothetical protein